jgi:hypothetical protein
MKQMLSYRTNLLAQTEIFSVILPMALSTPHQSVTGFINKCFDDVVLTVTVRPYPNEKPWITGNIRTELKCRAATFKEWDSNLEAYNKYRYALRRTIIQAKRQYRIKIESYYTGYDISRMWQGLQTITDCKGKHSHELPSDTNLPDELNYFMLASRQVTLKHA